MLVAAAGASACSSSVPPAPAHRSSTLGAGDLRGAWTKAGTQAPLRTAQLQQVATCLHRDLPAATHTSASTVYESRGGVKAFSFTESYPSAAAAHEAFTAWSAATFDACGEGLVPYVFSLLPAGTGFGTLATSTRGTPDIADGAVSHRLSLTVKVGTATTRASADLVTVLHGDQVTTVAFVAGPGASLSGIDEAAVAGDLAA